MGEATTNNTSEEAGTRLQIEAAQDLMPQRVVDWGRTATSWIVENPELSLGLAVALGVGIGLAVKHR